MDIQITEIREDKNFKNNLTIDQNPLILLNDYENFKAKLHNHNYALERLTQKVLKLSLFNIHKTNNAKLTHSKNNKLKNIRIKRQENSVKNELLIIKKLLVINLRSLQVVQRLYQENCDLQKLVDKSYQFVIDQRKQLGKIKRENKNLRVAEKHFKTGKFFFNKLDDISNKTFFQTGYPDYFIQRYGRQNFPKEKQEIFNFSSKALALIKNSDDLNNTLDDTKVTKLIQFYKEMFYCYDFNIALERLRKEIFSMGVNNSQNDFTNLILPKNYVDNRIKLIDTDLVNDPEENCDINKISFWQLVPSNLVHQTIDYENTSDFKSKERNPCISKISEEPNLSICQSFSFTGNIQEFIIPFTVFKFETIKFEPVYQKIQKTFILRNECTDIQPNIYSLPLSINWKNVKRNLSYDVNPDKLYQTYATVFESNIMRNNTNQNILNERINDYTDNSHPNIEIYHLERDKFQLNSSTIIQNIKLDTNLNTIQYNKFRKNINVGVGNSSTLLLDQESQANIDFLIEVPQQIKISKQNTDSISKIKKKFKNDAKEIRTKETVNKIKGEIVDKKKTKQPTIKNKSRQDFKKSLQSLEEVIEYCKNAPEQNSISRELQKRKKKINAKTFLLQSNVNVTKETKGQTSLIGTHRKDKNIISNMPEMSKMYQVVLQDRMPQGVSFKFVSSNNSNVQMLFIGNPYINNSSNIRRPLF